MSKKERWQMDGYENLKKDYNKSIAVAKGMSESIPSKTLDSDVVFAACLILAFTICRYPNKGYGLDHVKTLLDSLVLGDMLTDAERRGQ